MLALRPRLLQAWSRDGLHWSNLTIGAFGPNQNLANGSVWQNAYVERPQVVQDKAGHPLALFLGMSKLDGCTYCPSGSLSCRATRPQNRVLTTSLHFPAAQLTLR